MTQGYFGDPANSGSSVVLRPPLARGLPFSTAVQFDVLPGWVKAIDGPDAAGHHVATGEQPGSGVRAVQHCGMRRGGSFEINVSSTAEGGERWGVSSLGREAGRLEPSEKPSIRKGIRPHVSICRSRRQMQDSRCTCGSRRGGGGRDAHHPPLADMNLRDRESRSRMGCCQFRRSGRVIFARDRRRVCRSQKLDPSAR